MPTTLYSQQQPNVAVTFHAVESLRISERSTPTSHPVESGADVTDHVQKQATQIFLSRAIVSETPFLPDASTTPEVATANLERMRELGLVTLVTTQGVWKNLAIETLDWDKGRLAARIFTIALRQLRIASPVSVTIPARQPPPPARSACPTRWTRVRSPPPSRLLRWISLC